MGQYYMVLNLDKKEFINPHSFGNGLKLMEFGCSSCGVLTALAVLLASGNGRGGGDLHVTDPRAENIIGSWAGDRIVIAGDYDDADRFGIPTATEKEKGRNLYSVSHEPEWKDISVEVRRVICMDGLVKKEIGQPWNVEEMVKKGWKPERKDMAKELRARGVKLVMRPDLVIQPGPVPEKGVDNAPGSPSEN